MIAAVMSEVVAEPTNNVSIPKQSLWWLLTSQVGSPDIAFIDHSKRSASNAIGDGVETGRTLVISIGTELSSWRTRGGVASWLRSGSLQSGWLGWYP